MMMCYKRVWCVADVGIHIFAAVATVSRSLPSSNYCCFWHLNGEDFVPFIRFIHHFHGKDQPFASVEPPSDAVQQKDGRVDG